MCCCLSLSVAACLCGVFFDAASCCSGVQSEARRRSEPIKIRFEDLPEKIQNLAKSWVAETIMRAARDRVGDAQSFFKKHDITDPIERRLLDDDFDAYADQTGEEALYTVYVVKPGKQKAPVRLAELKDKDGKVLLRYTAVSGEVFEPLAFVCVIRVERGRPVVTEKLLSFNPKTGWKVKSAAPDKPEKDR